MIREEDGNERVFDETIELKDNAILRRRPELFDQWDFEKNDALGLNVYKVTFGSEKIAWWNCPDCKTPYDMDVKSRAGTGNPNRKGANCPYCAGKRINWTNSLASLFPHLISEWHPTLNGSLTPDAFTCNSGEKVWWLCLKCESPYDMVINDRSGEKKANCSYCRGLKVNHTNSLASLNPTLASEWHPTLNGKKTPDDFTCGSHERVWWLGKCGHKWKTGIDDRSKKNGTTCPYCIHNPKLLVGFNDVWATNPILASQLLNPEDGYKYTQSSGTKVDWKCLECENIIKNKTMNKINVRGLSCPRCSDGIEFPEKFMYNLLKGANIEFEFDTAQSWSEGKRYDFCLPEYNWIIEVHGIQHYGIGFSNIKGARALEEEQENDKLKERLAMKNGTMNYIVIDARHSTVEWIKAGVLSSDIMKIVEDIDFEEIGQLASHTLVKEACDLWMSGVHSTPAIAKILKLSRVTIRTYLKRGVEIGWCDYCPIEVRKNTAALAGKSSGKAVIQLDENSGFIKLWESAAEVERHTGIRACNISSVCRGERKMTHGFKWMLKKDYDEFINQKEIS